MRHKTTLAIVILFITGFVSMAYHFMGRVPAVVFTVASVGGFILLLPTR